MGLTFSPITITSNSLVYSDDLNSNFLSVMNAEQVTGDWHTATTNVYLVNTNWNLDISGTEFQVDVVRPEIGIVDRGMLFSVISGGVLKDSLLIHTNGTIYALQGIETWWGPDYYIYNGFTGSGTGVVSHGWSSSTPQCVVACPSGGSATGIGYDSLGSSTVKIYCSGSWNAMAVGP
jgi:hypothetical protein